jgi:hypothetical protein
MTAFILKSNDQTVEFDSLPPGQLKGAFFEVKTAIEFLLQSRACETHGSEPIIVVHGDSHGAVVAGVSTCCPEFGAKIHDLLQPYWDSMGSDIGVTERTTSYTYYS